MARKILLADDSVTAQNMGRRILSDAGYEVITVNNGSAALKKVAEVTPDLIVLDVYMPGYGGLEVCQRLKESQATSRIPVLLTVGKLEPFKVEEARRVRADAHIVKPFDSTELLAAIMKLEDKIVPQAAPSKPGRAAKSATETSSSRRSREKSADPASESSMGWKKRLSIPRATPAPEAKEVEVKTSEPAFQEFSAAKSEKPEEVITVETPAPNATPADSASIVEAKEITASARPFENFTVEHIKALEAAVPATEAAVAQNTAASPTLESPNTVNEAPPAGLIAKEEVAISRTKPAAGNNSPSEAEVMAALASLSPSETSDGSQRVGEAAIDTEAIELKFKKFADELPVSAVAVSMAAVGTVISGPRWVAESVPLSDGDAHLILESEMEKVYASFSAAENVPGPADVEPAAHSNAMQNDLMGVELPNLPEESVAESVSVSMQAQELSASVADVESPAPAPMTSQMDIDVAAPVIAGAVAEPAPSVETNTQIDAAWVDLKPAATQEESSSTGFREIAYAAAASAGSRGEPARGGTGFRAAEFAVSPAPPILEGPPQAADTLPPQAEAIAVEESSLIDEAHAALDKAVEAEREEMRVERSGEAQETRLAAAWQAWKQIRESVVGPQLTSQIADAAAAGFKQLRDEEKPEATGKTGVDMSDRAAAEAATIAGIVDSVFAELKPKLMEEIAKKLAAERR